MGWAFCGTEVYKGKKRRIGYGVEAMCDHPNCLEKIDRGLGYVCGSMHGDQGGRSCTGYFCWKHERFEVPAEDEDILASLNKDKTKTMEVCQDCYNGYLSAVKGLRAEARAEKNLNPKPRTKK